MQKVREATQTWHDATALLHQIFERVGRCLAFVDMPTEFGSLQVISIHDSSPINNDLT